MPAAHSVWADWPVEADVVAGVGVDAARLTGGWLVGAGRAGGLGGGSGGAHVVAASASMRLG